MGRVMIKEKNVRGRKRQQYSDERTREKNIGLCNEKRNVFL